MTVTDDLRELLQPLFLKHPDLATLTVTVALRGPAPEYVPALWLGRSGPVVDPADVLASCRETLRTLDGQLGRGFEVLDILTQRIAAASKQLGDSVEAPEEAQPGSGTG